MAVHVPTTLDSSGYAHLIYMYDEWVIHHNRGVPRMFITDRAPFARRHGGDASGGMMPKYPENLIQFNRPVLEHYELEDEMGRMFVRSMYCYIDYCSIYRCTSY